MFSGSIPALVTPFRDGSFDEAAYRSFIDWQIEEGSSALVPCGTTGEAATQSFEEHFEVVGVCVDQAAGRVPVIAGCGSNDTQSAIKNLKTAKEMGATAGLVVPPYYNKPSQEGIYRHFEAMIGECDLPIVLYNVPSRTASDISVETMQRLRKFPSVIGIKDATADMDRVSAQRAACGEDFCQLSGNDYLTLGYLAMGGTGCISVTANVAPRLCAEFQAAWARGDTAEALAINDRLYPLHGAMFADASPGPAKYALTKVFPGFPGEIRLPMTWPCEAAQAQVDSALSHASLLRD
ncbi:4-hydroxy-tetrahydrodipicolinate synthase [Parasphingopyxis lamellibrachiae]|uniref:4-hydroxy-tetrahydrodipicolinate synthase n=1 Tax=Parasphingopyxis lamellibrachiae TaxID=680125 RepID=A0A3D9FDH7_9SPHN|nr:4-hydroxy-tetrahydrodipicolinate synthase [Parasphingopyxis lamellibrachiae]RED15617.1 4-hydroxy-tetrahydrodipicolinate synthase [Parasphingopyxis lamellibrachiae]